MCPRPEQSRTAAIRRTTRALAVADPEAVIHDRDAQRLVTPKAVMWILGLCVSLANKDYGRLPIYEPEAERITEPSVIEAGRNPQECFLARQQNFRVRLRLPNGR